MQGLQGTVTIKGNKCGHGDTESSLRFVHGPMEKTKVDGCLLSRLDQDDKVLVKYGKSKNQAVKLLPAAPCAMVLVVPTVGFLVILLLCHRSKKTR